MVTITGYAVRINQDKQEFVVLQLQGDLVMVQSQETGRFYATTKRTTVASTFTEEQAKAFIGKEVAGRIERVDCEPYEYTIEDTGEVITLQHRWDFIPGNEPAPMRVVHKEAA